MYLHAALSLYTYIYVCVLGVVNTRLIDLECHTRQMHKPFQYIYTCVCVCVYTRFTCQITTNIINGAPNHRIHFVTCSIARDSSANTTYIYTLPCLTRTLSCRSTFSLSLSLCVYEFLTPMSFRSTLLRYVAVIRKYCNIEHRS